jgi:hypothetical protein
MFSISIIWMTALGCANVLVTDPTAFCLLVFCLLLNYFSVVNGRTKKMEKIQYRKDQGGPEVFGTNIFWVKNVNTMPVTQIRDSIFCCQHVRTIK